MSVGNNFTLCRLLCHPACIAATRQQLGLSISDVSKLVGVSDGLLSQIELGRRRLTPMVMPRLWNAFLAVDKERLQHPHKTPEILAVLREKGMPHE